MRRVIVLSLSVSVCVCATVAGWLRPLAHDPRVVSSSLSGPKVWWPKATFLRSHSHSRLLKISVRIMLVYGGPK